MLSPTGLWSFATSDNEDGAISQLRALVLKELSNQLRSRNQDEPRLLVLGDENPFDNGRRGGTRDQVEPAFFMIPIITPGYFSGGSQISHFAAFRERENLKLGRQDLIFPIVWIDLRGSD